MATFDSIQPGKPGAPTRTQHDLRSLAREHAPEALALIIKVLTSARATPQARIAAARTLLERGWGESLQEQVRPHRHEALKTLLEIMHDTGASLRTRLVAAEVLLDFGGNESRSRGVPAVMYDRQRWLDELKEIQSQLAAGRPVIERPGSTRN
jgi:hypothetical protein